MSADRLAGHPHLQRGRQPRATSSLRPRPSSSGGARQDHRILIVDDNSPDGTGAIADGWPRSPSGSRCCTARARAASGQAYLAGFARALAGGAQLVIEMDADFSHDPALPPGAARGGRGRRPRARLPLRAGRRRARLGPAAPADQPRRRALRARASSASHVRDLTGGFKCIRREVLEAIDLPSVRAEGYVFQIEVTYRAILAGFTRARDPDRVRRPRRWVPRRCPPESPSRRCCWCL